MTETPQKPFNTRKSVACQTTKPFCHSATTGSKKHYLSYRQLYLMTITSKITNQRFKKEKGGVQLSHSLKNNAQRMLTVTDK